MRRKPRFACLNLPQASEMDKGAFFPAGSGAYKENTSRMATTKVSGSPQRPLRNLSPEELERFATERVIHVSGVLPEEWIRKIGAAVDAQTSAGGLQSMVANSWFTDPAMHEIAMDCPTAWLAQQALDALTPEDDPSPRGNAKPVRFFYDQAFVKHPASPGQGRDADRDGDLGNTPWHHDITFWPMRGEQVVSLWIALDRTNLENGGLEFVPGSSFFGDSYRAVGVGEHGRVPFASDVLKELPPINSATTGETGAELTAISFDLEPGDILVFDAHILHGAPPNLSDRSRRGIALRYFGGDIVLDNDKYGTRTSMAPLDCYDESLSNGEKVRGFAYPQVLPERIPAEVEMRLQGPILPSETKMQGWLERMQAAAALQE